MLAMQGGPLIGPIDTSWSGWDTCNTHDKLRRLMDLPASMELGMNFRVTLNIKNPRITISSKLTPIKHDFEISWL